MTTQAAMDLAAYYSGSVREKLCTARRLYQRHGPRLSGNRDVTRSLQALQHKAAALEQQMQTMNMGARCRACAARVGGGCCSSYMAGNTDAVVLLINLLLGVAIEPIDNGDECCYLGAGGCMFLIKPIFCLNYNCSHIQQAATRGEMKALDLRAGALLSEQIALENLLLWLLENKE